MAKETKKEQKVKIPAKFKDLVEKIEKMSIVELAELVEILEKKFNVSAQPQVIASAMAPAAGGQSPSEGEAKQEEKTSFDVVVKEIGPSKIQVIKMVKEITGKGLKESKELVDKAPAVISGGVPKEQAEEFKKRLEEAGATVELK